MELDDAYANAAYIPEGDSFPAKWETDAVVFRDVTEGAELDLAYGPAARQKLDLFRPQGQAKGLLVFVHGGFWRMLDNSYWSHLAAGALARGWAVAPARDVAVAAPRPPQNLSGDWFSAALNKKR